MVNSGVHVAAYQACATKFGSLKQKCYGKQDILGELSTSATFTQPLAFVWSGTAIK